jgi:hypothetical protein
VRDPLTADDPLAVVLEFAGALIRLQCRRLGLFRLQDEWIPAVLAHQENHRGPVPTLPTPTTFRAMSANW